MPHKYQGSRRVDISHNYHSFQTEKTAEMPLPKILFLLIFSFTFLAPQYSAGQDLTTFILVRHAEKTDDGTDDPPLSTKGKERAQDLASMLKQADISAVYTTPYKRTRQTITPIARQKGLDINTYDPSESTFADSLFAKNKGGTILISGHSNTTPKVANFLLGEKRFDQFDESDYGNIFIITLKEKREAKIVNLRY